MSPDYSSPPGSQAGQNQIIFNFFMILVRVMYEFRPIFQIYWLKFLNIFVELLLVLGQISQHIDQNLLHFNFGQNVKQQI